MEIALTITPFQRLPLAALVTAAFGLVACGDDSGATRTVTVTAPAETVAASGEPVAVHDAQPNDLEAYQADLKIANCYPGPVDGSSGPLTQAAIRAFQAGAGLTVDGLLGPKTEDALEQTAKDKKQVCARPATAPATAPADASASTPKRTQAASLATVSSATYSNTFSLTGCSLNADVSNVSVRGTFEGLAFSADASSGKGNFSVSGAGEGAAVDVKGSIAKVTVGGDRSFTATGSLTSAGGAGEGFTIHGTCPE